MIDGYILWYRKAESNPILQCSKFDEFHAWIWLVERASFKKAVIPFGGKHKVLQRGQVWTSVRHLSSTWGWSKEKVRRFLDLLEANKMIKTKSDTNGTVITIENYSIYQPTQDTNEDTNKDANSPHINKKNKGHGQHRSDDRASAPFNDPRYYDIDPGEPEPW